jgi:hypothetical protein
MSVGTSLVDLGGPVLATGTVGALLTYFWHVRQKRREVALATTSQFYQLYGELIAVWKLWNFCCAAADKDKGWDEQVQELHDKRWDLLQRATGAAASAEAILVRLAAERKLSPRDIAVLGSFRQASHSVREAIQDGFPLPWTYDSAPGYLALKYLSAQVASIVARREPLKLPSAESAAGSLRAITANYWEAGQGGSWSSYETFDRWSDTETLRREVEELRIPRCWEELEATAETVWRRREDGCRRRSCLGSHLCQACSSYALFAARASDAQLSGRVKVTVVVRSLPGLPARCGTRVARPAKTNVVRACRCRHPSRSDPRTYRARFGACRMLVVALTPRRWAGSAGWHLHQLPAAAPTPCGP